MNILPIINRINELYQKKTVLKHVKKDINTSISYIRKERHQLYLKQKMDEKTTDKISCLDLSIIAAKERLEDIRGRIQPIEKEIERLSQLYISWSTVVFYDGYIKIVFDDYESRNIRVNESKDCFNYIRINLVRKLKPLKIAWKYHKMNFVLKDRVTFSSAILYLSIKHELSQTSNGSLFCIKNILNQIDNQFDFFSSFFDKSIYLEYLANRQSLDYKIIPTEEKIKIGSKQVIEDSFIFTVASPNFIYILWENINKERATFIFKTLKEEYDNDLQIIFDYVVGISTNKRRMLYLKQSKDRILNSCNILYHSDYRAWENKIETLLI